jgi:hypothetical protein
MFISVFISYGCEEWGEVGEVIVLYSSSNIGLYVSVLVSFIC